MAKLGDKVQDRICPDFSGVVTGRAEYLYGCVQVLVNPGVFKDGKLTDSVWLDEDRCAVIAHAAVEQPPSAAVRAGGPAIDALPPSGKR